MLRNLHNVTSILLAFVVLAVVVGLLMNKSFLCGKLRAFPSAMSVEHFAHCSRDSLFHCYLPYCT